MDSYILESILQCIFVGASMVIAFLKILWMAGLILKSNTENITFPNPTWSSEDSNINPPLAEMVFDLIKFVPEIYHTSTVSQKKSVKSWIFLEIG